MVISLEFQGNKASTAFYDTANKNFIQLFPLEESMVKALCRLFLWNFKEKHGPVKNMALLWYAVVSSPQCGKNTGFFSSFPLGGLHG
ncbi:MAG: hypothetical protein KH745_04705 [Bilophila sp.]|nr:hypothetical protein [Bilophila sp.]